MLKSDDYYYVLNKAPADRARRIIHNADATGYALRCIIIAALATAQEIKTSEGREGVSHYALTDIQGDPVVIKINTTKKRAPDGIKRLAYICGVWRESEWYDYDKRQGTRACG